jgi:capsular exopolysaccharide synthesis family protein
MNSRGFVFLLSLSLCLQATAGDTIYRNVGIRFSYHPAIFPEAWREAPILARGSRLSNSEEDRCTMVTVRALSKYPVDLLRLNLQLSLAETRGGRTILFTSAVPGQGKSFVSANLAYLIANAGPRVLLIDADLRLSSIGRDVAVGGSKGLSDVLREGLDPSALVKTDPTMNLSVLPAGAAPDNPGELLTTERLEPVFAWSASRYDIVIVDAPPILPVSNAVLLGAFADVTAFVRIDESARTCTRDGSLSNPTTRGTCAPSASRLGFTLASLAPIDSQCTHRCHSSARAKASSSSAISDRQPSAATSRKRSR